MKAYIICCIFVQISYLGKIWFVKYEPKMLLANQIVGFSNQLYLRNKMMKKLDFLDVDIN